MSIRYDLKSLLRAYLDTGAPVSILKIGVMPISRDMATSRYVP